MKPKKAQKLSVCMWLTGMILLLFGYIHIIFLIIGLTTAISGAVVNILFNKCPHCGKHLVNNGGNFCQFCGREIDE